ncbi:MAG: hypothetical protein ACRDRA_03890 [Pseudonocardiaceae bacterium]
MQTPVRTKAKKGRVPKGDRVGTLVRLPTELREHAQTIATQEGLPLGDVITRMVAEALGQQAPAYCYPKPQMQEELPLNKAS